MIAENESVVAEFYLEVFFPEKRHPEYDQDQDENSENNRKRGVPSVNRIFISFSCHNMYFPWSGPEKSVDEILNPLGIVIETVTLLTQRLTHVRKTKSGVRKMSDVSR